LPVQKNKYFENYFVSMFINLYNFEFTVIF
jgi:hypothetical protein